MFGYVWAGLFYIQVGKGVHEFKGVLFKESKIRNKKQEPTPCSDRATRVLAVVMPDEGGVLVEGDSLASRAAEVG